MRKSPARRVNRSARSRPASGAACWPCAKRSRIIMTEVPSNEDDALRFVMGEFSAAERREFEARLAASAELRALVNELEAGLVITATAAPRHRPPAEVWRRIEKAVAKTTPLQPGFLVPWFGWMRNGWAVAVICLAGWLGYAFLAHLHYASALAKVKNQRHNACGQGMRSPA